MTAPVPDHASLPVEQLRRAAILARFESHISPEPNTGCWLWLGCLNAKGYGRFSNTTAQRASHVLYKGAVPGEFTVDHLCRMRSCVNPAHIEAVPHHENLRRGAAARETGSCLHGHPREMFGAGRAGKRRCRECDRLRGVRLYKKTSTRKRYRWLSNEQKWRIKTLIGAGCSHSEIATIVGVSIGTISRVRNSDA